MKNLDLKQFADENRLPIMDSIQFKRWTDEIGKEKFRELLTEYIAEYRPEFPLNNILLILFGYSWSLNILYQ